MKQKHLFFISAMAVMFMFFTVRTGYGFNPADLAKLKTTGHCPSCDLVGADLSGAKLPKADLSNANLSDADLTGADLTGAHLSNTILTGATWVDRSTCQAGSIGQCKK